MVGHYYPSSLEETLIELKKNRYQIIAGGTDVLVQYRSWSETVPKVKYPLMFIHHLSELKFMTENIDYIEIGACVTYKDLLSSPLIPKVLKDTIIEIASPGIRHTATLGGNIANASPAADAVCTLIALDAMVVIKSLDSIRTEKIDDFITGVKKTSLKPDEIIYSVKIPNVMSDYACFYKVGGRQADAISKVSLAAVMNANDGRITKWRMAFGAVGPKVMTNLSIDGLMIGKTIEEIKTTMPAILEQYSTLINPIDDQRSTAKYRKLVAMNLIQKFIDTIS